MKETTMPADGASGAAAAGLAWKLGLIQKLAALVSVGAVGALVMAAVDPPATRKALFLQSLAAGLMSILFTPGIVRWLDSIFEFIDMRGADVEQWAEVALPVGFILGALSWGILGAMVKLRALVKDRGAETLLKRTGLGE